MFLSKNYRINYWGIFIGNSLQDFAWNFGPSVIGSVNGKVFSVMGPKHYQIDLLGMFSGNDPVKNCGK